MILEQLWTWWSLIPVENVRQQETDNVRGAQPLGGEILRGKKDTVANLHQKWSEKVFGGGDI